MIYDGKFSTNAKKLRLARHWTMDQLAEISGISKSTISRLESGNDVYFSTLVILCKVFEVNLSDLVIM